MPFRTELAHKMVECTSPRKLLCSYKTNRALSAADAIGGTARPSPSAMSDVGLVELRWLRGRSQWKFASEAAFIVQPREGCGLGVFARYDFEPGDCLIAEKPLAAWDIDTSSAHTDLAELDKIVDALSPSERRDFLDLCDSHACSGQPKTLFGIWSSNAYMREFGDCFEPAEDHISHAAVFSTICRINHACRPNAHVAWNHGSRRQTVHALRRIAAGEEITVCYLGAGALATRATRFVTLSRTKRFYCVCAACSLSGQALAESEERMRRVASLQAQLLEPAASHSAPLVELLDELWRLAVAEGAPGAWLRAEVLAGMVHAQKAGSDALALQWAQRGAESARLALGADAPTTSKFEILAKRASARIRDALHV